MVGAIALTSWASRLGLCSTRTSLATKMTVFCDFDGPIVDVSNRYYSTYRRGLADTQAAYHSAGSCLPIQPLTKKQFWQLKQNRVPDVDIAARSGLCDDQIDRFLGHVNQIVNQADLLEQDRLQPGVREALTWLNARGVQLVLVTLRCQDQATAILQQYGLAHLFQCIRGTCDREAAYHNYTERKMQLLSEVLAERPPASETMDSAWMIGDTEADILAGQALGLSTIALTCGIRSQVYLQRFQPTRIDPDLLSAVRHLLQVSKLSQV